MRSAEMKEKLSEIAGRHEFSEIMTKIEEQMQDEELSIAMVGAFNAGKSTLINALLGAKVLPALEKPTTAAIVEVLPRSSWQAWTVNKSSGEKQEIGMDDLSDYIMGNKADKNVKIELHTPSNGNIDYGLRIIDTPGVESLNDVHDDITFGYLPFVDAVMLVIDINQGAVTKSLMDFIENKIIAENGLSRLYVVLSRAGSVSKGKREEILSTIKTQLSETIPADRVIAVDSVIALSGDTVDSGIEDVKAVLADIQTQKQGLLERKRSLRLREFADILEDVLQRKEKALMFTTPELDKEILTVKADMERLEETKAEIENAFEALKRKVDNKIDKLAQDNSVNITGKAISDEADEMEIDNIIWEMVEEISNYIQNEYLKTIGTINNSINVDSSKHIANKIRNSVEGAKVAVDVGGTVIGVFLGNAIIGSVGAVAGGSVGGLTKLKQVVGIVKKPGVLSKALPIIGRIAQDLNLPGKVLTYAAKQAMQKSVENQLRQGLQGAAANVISVLLEELNARLEDEVFAPQRLQEEMLQNVRSTRDSQVSAVKELKKHIQVDIEKIRGIKQ